MNKQQMLQLGMIQDGLNLSNTENYMNILPELSDGLQVLLETLVKRYSRDVSKSGFNMIILLYIYKYNSMSKLLFSVPL